MLQTRTGGFPIGFRRGWSDWQKDTQGLIAWAKANNLGVIDLGGNADTEGAAVVAAGLKVGSADLKSWSGFLSKDPHKRQAAVEANDAYFAECAKHGIRNYFTVMLPEDAALLRAENFGYMVEGLTALVPVLEKHGGRLVIEGWPGPGALACTPEGYRALIERVPSETIGINYDPSHLVRMGIDPIRFVEEFASRVYHVHGKDTELLAEGLYEYGTEQPATFGTNRGFGAMHWRYTIPGQGVVRWTRAFEILHDAGYQGAVSIELEDEHFNTDEAGEKAGLLAGASFLAAA